MRCALETTSIGISKYRYVVPKGNIPWNKGVEYSEELKSRLDTRGLEKGRGLFKGKSRPELQGKNSPLWKKRRIVVCLCGTLLEFAPWEKNRKFCSLQCRGLAKRGINSPVYKGENAVGKLRIRIHQLPEYTNWRFTIMKRDNFTCQTCKDPKAKPREVHHIKSYKDIKKQYSFTTVEGARMCKELWNLENGVTICRECHRKTDSYPKNLN